MGRGELTVGTRYLHKEQAYVVRRVLAGGKVEVENLTFGGATIVPLIDLWTAWASEELVLGRRGKYAVAGGDPAVLTNHTLADFDVLPEKQRAEAWRRYQIILPLLQLPAKERTRTAIADYVAQNFSPANEEGEYGSQRRRGATGTATSTASIERWLKAYNESGGDISSLVPATHRSGALGRSRLKGDHDRIIEAVIAECIANPARRTAYEVYLEVVRRIEQENRTTPAGRPKLDLPSEMTVRRRIDATGRHLVLRRQLSRIEAEAEAGVMPTAKPTRILERVEIDHTLLDLFVVDEDDRFPIGRPTLTLALDVYSGYPYGLYVGFEPPSYLTVQSCLLHGIMPKPDVRQLYGTQHDWPVFGLPETVVVDNGKEFIGRSLRDACGQLGINLSQMPVQKPWYKGAVERFFRTHNTGLLHSLPGTSYSNIVDRGDYDAVRHACISLNAFIEMLHVFIVDVYAESWHKGKGGIPARLWERSISQGFSPVAPPAARDLRIMLYGSEERTVQRSGIEFESLRYQSADLIQLRSGKGTGRTEQVPIRYNPADLGSIYVYDHKAGSWLEVASTDAGYAQGLPLWKHRRIREVLLREKGEVNIVALAEAKRRIQEIHAREYDQTRKIRGRRSAARYLGIGTMGQAEPPAATPAVQPPAPPTGQASNVADAPPNKPRKTKSKATTPPQLVASTLGVDEVTTDQPVASQPADVSRYSLYDQDDAEGWGGDYHLPKASTNPTVLHKGERR